MDLKHCKTIFNGGRAQNWLNSKNEMNGTLIQRVRSESVKVEMFQERRRETTHFATSESDKETVIKDKKLIGCSFDDKGRRDQGLVARGEECMKKQ